MQTHATTAFWLDHATVDCHLAMPSAQRKAAAAARQTCAVDSAHRSWKDHHAVRRLAVKADRLFEPSKPSDGDEKPPVKFCIKDAVYNQHVLVPLLERMAEFPHHPLPRVKPLAHEHPSWDLVHNMFCCFMSWFLANPTKDDPCQ